MATESRKKAALYLVSQDTYRDPSIFDLHYIRILHHSDTLKAILDSKIDIVSTYCDYRCPRQNRFRYPESFPGLKALIDAYSHKEFDIVLVDLEFGHPYHPQEWDIIVSELKETGIPTYKSFSSEAQTLGQSMANRFETIDEFGVFSFGAGDFVALFQPLPYAAREEQ
jgi:hypothetical protein